MKKKDNSLKIQCASCERETNHKQLWEKNIHEDFDEGNIWQDITYSAYSCRGCNTITFRIVSTNSEETETAENGEEIALTEHINYYPKRSIRMIKERFDIYDAPPKVRRIYHETIEAYNNELPILCGVGIRAIIEAICLGEGITVHGLDNKINALIQKGVVTAKLGEGLHENRLLGNESAHELESFGDMQLSIAIRLIENVIENHYSTPSNIRLLKARKFNKRAPSE